MIAMKNLTLQFRMMWLLTLTLLAATAGYSQITPLGDSYTNTAASTTNYGATTQITVDAAADVSYIQFNLASIPAGSVVSQATLKLYVNSVTTAGSFNVDYVNGAWTESTIDASNAPPLGTAIASSIAVTAAEKNQYILVNVTSALQAWLNETETNNGIALVANSTFHATFDSKESTTTSHAPELDIVFAGGGTLTGITTASGSGLTGGGTNGTLALSLTNTCTSGQVLEWNGTAWACTTAKGTGTITGVTAGTDLTGGGTSGNVTLNLNTSALNSSYAQLGAANTFTGNQTVNGTITATSAGKTILATSTSSTDTASIGIGVVAGVYGSASAATGFGVYGSGSFGVYGSDNTSAGNGNGVYGVSPGVGYGVVGSSTGGTGVYGSGAEYGVSGQDTSGTGSGVSGASTGGYGVYGSSTDGYGVYGSSAEYVGVYGQGSFASGLGVFANGTSGAYGTFTQSDTGTAILAQSSSGTGALVYANAANALYAQNNDSTGDYPTMVAANDTSQTHNPVFQTSSPNTYSGTRHCTIDTSANLTCTGVISGVVQQVDGKQTAIYAMQSAENWLEDAGSGQLSNGSVRIQLDAAFAQTVNAGVEYHVFLTPNGDSKGLYVSHKTATSFEVHEQGGGVSSIAFDYRIMVKRVGYENVRLEDLTERLRQHPLPAQKARPVVPRPMPALRSLAKPIPLPMMATPRPMHPMVAPAPTLPSAQTSKPEINQK
jgi:hypothetical protein